MSLMSSYRQQLDEVIQATALCSPTRFAWFGTPSPQLDVATDRAVGRLDARAYLLFILRMRLYSDFYCAGHAVPIAPDAIVQRRPVLDATPFVQSLSAANGGTGCWEAGWVARSIEHGMVIASRGNLRLHARSEDCVAEDGAPIAPGSALKLHVPKELLRIAPGFYMAVGNASPAAAAAGADRAVVRLYWHLCAAGAVRFIRQVTGALNRAGLPFRLKVVNDPEGYTRRDAGVLYIARADYPAAACALAEIYPALAELLRPGTPALTKPLAHGLGLAEDPGTEDSFGMHRCGLVAEGLIRAYERRLRSDAARRRMVEECFQESQVSLEAPFLNPGSRDDYRFQPGSQRRPRGAHDSHATRPRPRRETTYLGVAQALGRRLVDEAIWHDGRCTWMGATLAFASTAAPTRVIYETLGADLYAGTSGVAWFLAHLAVASGDAAVRRTALGALRQALARSDKVAPPGNIGLYTGRSGIALAAASIGTLLGESELVERAAQLILQVAHTAPEPPEFDLLAGAAGAIVALLALDAILRDRELVAFAARLGDTLLRAARQVGAACSWPHTNQPRQRHLTGHSHGAAGIGYALLELFSATHKRAYRDGAEAAFRYERDCFDAAAGNWPDFRDELATQRRKGDPRRCSTTWCHGAPGIALSRLRAYALLGDACHAAEALTALRTTHAAITETLAAGTGNFSLCHGLAGNAEILIRGEQVLGDRAPGGWEMARAVADAGIEAYAVDGATWPCGTSAGESPSLMLGLAGIGHFYLRLHDPSLPDILSLQPSSDHSGVTSDADSVASTRSISPA